MEFFAIICIPCNAAILYFTGYREKIADPITGEITTTVYNNLRIVLNAKNPEFWTPLMVAGMLVLLEHLLVGLKIMIASFIPDVNSKVHNAEIKRPQIIEKAEQELADLKVTTNAETFDELMKKNN